jgi:integrase
MVRVVASIRERRPGVWEVRVFTGRDESGRPVQTSHTVRGTKRDAMRLAATYDSRPPTHSAGRTVADVLNAWVEINQEVWAESSRRDQEGRVAKVGADPIAAMPVARLGVADVERWHARMRRAGLREMAIRNRHEVLRAALAQAVRWEWIATNPAAAARLRRPKRVPRDGMSIETVRAAIAAAREIDPAAGLALRLAAVAGLRRAELAALRWDDLEGPELTVDKAVELVRTAQHRQPELRLAPTKTANRRRIRLDSQTLAELEALRVEREPVSPYLFSLEPHPPSPARIGWWWTRARRVAGIDPKWRLHDLRHWTATAAIRGGHDVRTVAGRLGHANPAMTLRVYAHVVEGADEALASTLGQALDGASPS